MTDETLWAEGILGKQAEMFVESDIGQAMIGLARQEVDSAFEEFKMADVNNTKLMHEIQNRIWRAESFQNWLSELIVAGHQAVKTIELQRADDQS